MDRNTLSTDDGASTAMLLTVFAALMLVMAAALTLLHVHVAASRVAVAADLAALAAADAARGLMLGDPCALAAETVATHGATMTDCDIAAPGVAHIQVQLETPIGLTATGQSRAGPKLP